MVSAVLGSSSTTRRRGLATPQCTASPGRAENELPILGIGGVVGLVGATARLVAALIAGLALELIEVAVVGGFLLRPRSGAGAVGQLGPRRLLIRVGLIGALALARAPRWGLRALPRALLILRLIGAAALR